MIEQVLGDARGSYEEKLRALGELRTVVAALPGGAQRTLFLAEIARTLGLSQQDVAAFFRGDRKREEDNPAAASQQAPLRRGPRPPGSAPARRRELELVALLVARPGARREFGHAVAAAVRHPTLRELAGLLAEGTLPEEEIFDRLETGLAQALAARVQAALRGPERDVGQEIEDGLLQVELERLQEERRAVIAERERLDRARGAVPVDGDEYRELTAAIEECGALAGALREEMERVRARLRGAA